MTDAADHPLVPFNIGDLSPYVAGKTIAEVKAAYNHSQISKLASNENRLGCSAKVKPAVMNALQEIQDYPDPISRKLRKALAKENEVNPENILLGAGSESLISIICRTFFLNEEEAITADATFIGFFVQAKVQNITLHKIPVTKEYGYDLDSMAKAVNAQTKMIYIANPNNPTGTYISKAQFEQFMSRIPDHVLIVIDEAYYEFANNIPEYPDSLDYKFDNVITLRTFSKAYGLAGLRVGYAIASEEVIAHMTKTKLTFEPTALAQAGALAALKDHAFLQKSQEMVSSGKERLYEFLDHHKISYTPSASNSVMIILSNEDEAMNFTQAMLENGVILRHIKGFGLPSGVRITVGLKEEMSHFEHSFKQVMN